MVEPTHSAFFAASIILPSHRNLTHNESHSIWQEFVTVIFDDFSEVVLNPNNKQNRVAVFFPIPFRF
jgi:hypothetical protein